MIKAVIFDMDGTLLDTELVFRTVVFDVATELGYEMTNALHLAMVGSSHEETSRLLVEAYGASFPYGIFESRCRDLMHEQMAETVPVKHGAVALLTELRNRRIPIAVATSSRSMHAFGHLDLLYPKSQLTPARALEIAIEGETYEYTEMYPKFRHLAEEEGNKAAVAEYDEQIAESKEHAENFRRTLEKAAKRFAALAKVEERHANHYRAVLETVKA